MDYGWGEYTKALGGSLGAALLYVNFIAARHILSRPLDIEKERVESELKEKFDTNIFYRFIYPLASYLTQPGRDLGYYLRNKTVIKDE
ncbi:MAG: hypothetical protein HYW24_03165 [Candidatus Aenigmarchaeota archaeon]|nr:hypothetical protein [Candidatus Aenigmarchaeota archaeon]